MSEATIPVLIGKDNYLFLSNDANDSVSQFTGETKLGERSIAGWQQHFRSIKRWASDYGYRSAFLVAPAKEYVLTNMMPDHLVRGVDAPIDSFRRIQGAEEVIYPVPILQRMRYYAYDRVDSHWTDAGCSIAAAEVAKFWGFDAAETVQPLSGFRMKMSMGDLGSKFTPPKIDYTLAFDWSIKDIIAFDNMINNHANIRRRATRRC
jgi:hypothetical protein